MQGSRSINSHSTAFFSRTFRTVNTLLTVTSTIGRSTLLLRGIGRRQRLGKPTHHGGRDFHVVLFQHHHVAITVDASVPKLHMGGVDARPVQKLQRGLIAKSCAETSAGIRRIREHSGRWLLL